MSNLSDWYQNMGRKDDEDDVISKPINAVDNFQVKGENTTSKEELFRRIADFLDRKEQSKSNDGGNTETNVSVKMPDGQVNDVAIQKQEVKQELPIVVNPVSDAETIPVNDRLDRDTVSPAPKEYVEKRDDILVDKLIAINTSAGHLIQRLSLYSNYLTQPLEHLERKKVLEQLLKLQTTYGTILAELNTV
jgi:hypothetical protein